MVVAIDVASKIENGSVYYSTATHLSTPAGLGKILALFQSLREENMLRNNFHKMAAATGCVALTRKPG
ncbi:MAG: hypothetical protein OXU34_02860 [Gammaproteobacteria bacterium]|nr:hypothetical protein [Gammaproteobacteria bacterium]